jgi:LPS-assembly protein
MKRRQGAVVLSACMTILLVVLCLPRDILGAATLTADNLENLAAENKYVATGNVVITRDGALYKADRAVYNEKTQDMSLSGHVTLEDSDFIIKTEQAEFNSGSKTGILNNAIIYLKHGKNWIRGINLQKLGDNHYYGKVVYFTACESESYRTARSLKSGELGTSGEKPDWCFRGEDANIYVGDKMTAKNATFRVRDMAVLYTPYFQGPVDNERKSGFLIPQFGSSSKKGFMIRPSYYLAIDENRDATVAADYYSRRGGGGSLEYRFREPHHEGEWYGYYLRDWSMKENFAVARISDRYTTPELQAFLDINYVNRWNYYNEYGDTHAITVNRFLQSSAEVSAPVSLGSSSRVYLLNQYWVNLRGDITEHVPQKLPEAGYVLNPTRLGPFMLSLSANAANFVREFDPNGQRFDILPTISHSFGDVVRVTQSVSIRETFYNLEDQGNFGSNPHREMFQYRGQAQMRFVKNYGSFMHVIEPAVEYNYIPDATVLPLFDATELPTKESVVSAGVTNRLVFRNFTTSLHISQPYDTFAPAKSAILPSVFRGNINGPGLPVTVNALAAYDTTNKKLDTFNSSLSFRVFRNVTLGLGELYSDVDGMMLFFSSLTATLSRNWMASVGGSYDVRAPHKIRDLFAQLTYKEQCWSIKTIFNRKPPDDTNNKSAEYMFVVLLELRGFGALKF